MESEKLLIGMYRNWESETYGVSERYQVLICRVLDMSPTATGRIIVRA
jgi:hypothetical protein